MQKFGSCHTAVWREVFYTDQNLKRFDRKLTRRRTSTTTILELCALPFYFYPLRMPIALDPPVDANELEPLQPATDATRGPLPSSPLIRPCSSVVRKRTLKPPLSFIENFFWSTAGGQRGGL